MLTHHLGGRVEVRLAAPEQLPGGVGELRQEVLRVPPEPELVRPPLQQNMDSAKTCWQIISLWPTSDRSRGRSAPPDAHTVPQHHFQSTTVHALVLHWNHVSPQTSKEGEPQQLSSPRQGAKALERALRMCSEKRPISLSSSATGVMRVACFTINPCYGQSHLMQCSTKTQQALRLA